MQQEEQRQTPQAPARDSQEAEHMRLAALESADPALTPILAAVVSEFMRSEPLPAS